MSDKLIPCQGCGAQIELKKGILHPYIGAAAGCWEIYGQVLAKQFGEYSYPEDIQRMTVDVYAIQHPGIPERRSIQSVNGHLVSLYLMLERNLSGKEATRKLGEFLSLDPVLQWLEPPVPNGRLTIADVAMAASRDDHMRKVEEWTADVWGCWSKLYRSEIEKLVNDYLDR